jgi:hypothetical protein
MRAVFAARACCAAVSAPRLSRGVSATAAVYRNVPATTLPDDVDLYRVLGVSSDASMENIKDAYRNLGAAFVCHTAVVVSVVRSSLVLAASWWLCGVRQRSSTTRMS